MAPTTKVTKSKDSPVKTPKGKRTERRPTAGSPTKPACALVTEANMQLLWACVKGFLADGQTVNYAALSSELGISKNAASVRFYRLRDALEKTESTTKVTQAPEKVKEESMKVVKTESQESTPVKKEDSYVEADVMEDA